MTQIRLLSFSSCEKILNFRSDNEIRELYNEQEFNTNGLTFLSDTININLTIDQFDLGVNSSDDLDNSIKIFTALKNIDLVQANDKRLWTTLTHVYFYKYAKGRWKINNSTSNEVIKDRFHFEGTGLRARNQNSLARLWWAARITFKENKDDPFELTRLLWERQDFYQNLIDRKFSTYSDTLNGFLKFYAKNRHVDLKNDMRKLFKGINALGGVRVLSLLNEKEIEKQLNRLCKFYNIDSNAA